MNSASFIYIFMHTIYAIIIRGYKFEREIEGDMGMFKWRDGVEDVIIF